MWARGRRPRVRRIAERSRRSNCISASTFHGSLTFRLTSALELVGLENRISLIDAVSDRLAGEKVFQAGEGERAVEVVVGFGAFPFISSVEPRLDGHVAARVLQQVAEIERGVFARLSVGRASPAEGAANVEMGRVEQRDAAFGVTGDPESDLVVQRRGEDRRS